ncbi:MAG: penicillin acylase family protein, partial [Candidatus Corynebacterium faecigallinarum]
MAQHGRSQDAASQDEATGGPKSTDTAVRRRRPRRGRRILLGTLAGGLVLIIIATAFLTWSVVRAFPQTEGSIDVPGLQSEVTVHRDGHGIPTLTAETSEDLFRAQGFVHAQDRFWEMDFRRHMTSGRLSELFGEAQVETDSFLRTLGWHRVAQEEVDALPEEVLGYYEAYADGVNAYLDERQGGALAFEYTVLGLQNPDYEPEPWTPTDSVAWLKAMAWDLRTNIEDETSRALLEPDLGPERLTELYPDYPFDEHPVIMAEDPDASTPAQADIPAPATAEVPAGTEVPADVADSADADTAPDSAESSAASHGLASLDFASLDFDSSGLSDLLTTVDALVGGAGEGIGSNSWVVSGEHTATGDPLLANDPHLGASLPSVWSQMQLRCAEVTEECPFAVAGYSFSGLPGIVIGHNQQIAWGFTNLTTDVADLYVERLTEDGYERDGETVPFETRQETIRVAGGDDVDLQVRSTGHGPIVSGLTPEFTSIANAPSDGATAAADEAAEDSALPDGDYALSLRWTALDAGSTAQAIFSLNLAEDFSEFRQAASQFDVPAQSLVYADTAGNIGYQTPGRLPIRGEGDGWLPQPGWDSAYDW